MSHPVPAILIAAYTPGRGISGGAAMRRLMVLAAVLASGQTAGALEMLLTGQVTWPHEVADLGETVTVSIEFDGLTPDRYACDYEARTCYVGTATVDGRVFLGEPRYAKVSITHVPALTDNLSLEIAGSANWLHFIFSDAGSPFFPGTEITDIPTIHQFGPVIFANNRRYEHPRISSALLWIDVVSMEVSHNDLTPGDANGDGQFDQLDLVQVAGAGKYGTGAIAPWSQGDWNADGVFDQLDLVAAQQAGGYRVEAQAARAVPEPSTEHICLSVFAAAVCSILRRALCGKLSQSNRSIP